MTGNNNTTDEESDEITAQPRESERSDSAQVSLEDYNEGAASSSCEIESICQAVVDGEKAVPATALKRLEFAVNDTETSADEILAVFPAISDLDSLYEQRWALELFGSSIDECPEAGLKHSTQLVELLSHDDHDIRERALAALVVLAEEDSSELTLTNVDVERLLESDSEMRLHVYRLLELVGTASAVPILENWQNWERGNTAEACHAAIRAIKRRGESEEGDEHA